MTINSEDLLNSILDSLDRIEYIDPDDIPNIDLYMDQVTTFVDRRLRSSSRNPEEDKVLTKTMINNYAKNNLLPPPVKKKYSKEHILLLIFIYYFKGILSISDIQTLFRPITEEFFQNGQEFDLEDVYREIMSVGLEHVQTMKEDVKEKFKESERMFADAPEKNKAFLQKFSFICLLSHDVYVKRLMIEKLIDELAKENAASTNNSKDKNEKDKK
ncbi:MAG: DUF1836 domain-containing protein [Acetatifactor sp.]|nr:DUF1836 domain-containing protein [Acetatifactor sp.]